MTVRTKHKNETALSVHRKGHWRNKFFSLSGWTDCDPEAIHVDFETCILSDKFASEADAERAGRERLKDAEPPDGSWYMPGSPLHYLGPVFFPEGGDQ